MKVNDLWKLSATSVCRAKTHSLLCILAVCIGIASVTIILGFSDAATTVVANEIDGMGIRGAMLYHKKGEALSAEVIQAVSGTDGVRGTIPFSVTTGTIQLRNIRSSTAVFGVESPVESVLELEVLHGTLLTEQQLRSAAKVIVIDAAFAQKAYGRANVVGKTLEITINNVCEKLEICGVIQSQSEGLSMLVGSQFPHIVYIPGKVLRSIAPSLNTSNLLLKGEAEVLSQLVQSIAARLNRTFGNEFKMENLSYYLENIMTIADTMTLLVSTVAAISVIVGGIGVMNAMISAVDIRTREIGIYRALGAKNQMIVALFLCEAILLCVLGGLGGLGLSALLFYLSKTPVNLSVIQHGIWISFVCGVIFGILPAIKALRLDPIVAIRSE